MPKVHYDKDIWNKFTLNNNSNHPLLGNSKFLKYEKRITRVFLNSSSKVYSEFDSSLLEDCLEHSLKYSKNIKGNKIIGLVHPFYTGLSEMDCLNPFMKITYKKYINNLKKLFDKKNKEIVIFDTIHHYAAITSRLLEEGIVDKVIITENDRGNLMNKKEGKIFNNKTIFLGGGYSGRCLTSCARDIISESSSIFSNPIIWRRGINNIKDVRWIKGLSLDSPQDSYFNLFSKKVYPLIESVTLDSLLI